MRRRGFLLGSLAAALYRCGTGSGLRGPAVVWIAGQSNAMGPWGEVDTGQPREGLPLVDPPGLPRGDLPYWWRWLALADPAAPEPLGSRDTYAGRHDYVGCEEALGVTLSEGDPLAVCKTARGSTGLATHWAPTGAEWLDARDSLRAFLDHLAADPAAQPYVTALVWIQWEEDALSQADTDAYETRLRDLIDRVRAWVHPDLPVVLTAASREVTSRSASRIDTIRQAQAAVATDPLVTLVETTGLALTADGGHYTPDAQRMLGEMCAEAIACMPVPSSDGHVYTPGAS